MPEPVQPAYRCDGREVDPATFYALACDPRRHVAVEACAGAGKTWMLVSRIVRALLDGAEPSSILAITFTRKAAGEMRARLQQWLTEFAVADDATLRAQLALRGCPDADAAQCEALRTLGDRLLLAGRPVQIRTFHGWFAALLREAPFAVAQSLGLPARYELLEDDADAVQRVWRRFHVAVHADAALREDYFAAVAAHGRFNTRKALTAALDKRVEFAAADRHGVVDASVQRMQAVFAEFAALASIEEALALAPVRRTFLQAARTLGGGSARFAEIATALEQAVTAGDLGGALDALRTKAGDLRKLGDRYESLPEIVAAQTLVQRLLAARSQEEAWTHQQRLARLTRRLVAEFAALKREHGWVDMGDVERAAAVLLADPVASGWIQERLDLRIRHLLVDEFQDTNALQWQALGAWLQSYAGAGGTGPGVFLVGDPKQSIYRFRRAEPEVFRAAQAFIGDELGGVRLACDHTRRNAPELLETVNDVFTEAQRQGQYDGFRAHTTAAGAGGSFVRLPVVPRPATEGDDTTGTVPASWRDSLTVPRETAEEHLLALECRQAAAWIAAQVRAGARPKDFLVLARRRDRLAFMQDELRALHLPAQQPEKTDLSDAPEVQDLTALLDVLVSPDHDLSLARALKSPLFDADDAALVELAQRARAARAAGSRRAWFDLLQEGGLDAPALREAAEALPRWQALLREVPPHDVLQAIYLERGVPARFARAAPAALRDGVLANVRALPGAALEVGQGRWLTPYAFVRALKAGGLRGPAWTAPDAIRLLTVHGAKGLEAPVVVLLDTDAAPPRPESMTVLCTWPGQAAAPTRFAFLASETRPPPCSEAAMAEERRERAREELNGLYVALTRAERQVVLSAVAPWRPNPDSWFARLGWHAAALPAPPATPRAGTTDEANFTLPALPALPPGSASARAAGSAPLRASIEQRVGQAMHRLIERWQGQREFAALEVAAVAREFELAEADAARAALFARRILRGDAAWAWDATVVDWAANEVEFAWRGNVLRIDRLVKRRDTGEWWVLDHKSAEHAEDDPAIRGKMAEYAEAVAASVPAGRVRAALLTARGRIVELA